MSADRQGPKDRQTPAIEIRLATVDDVEQLTVLAKAVFNAADSYHPHLTWSSERMRAWMTTAISTGCQPHIIAVDRSSGRVVGVFSYSMDYTFSDPPMAIMGEVFAYPETRKQFPAVGRALVLIGMFHAKEAGAVCMHIPITAGLKTAGTIINLFRKFGADVIGVIMRKVL